MYTSYGVLETVVGNGEVVVVVAGGCLLVVPSSGFNVMFNNKFSQLPSVVTVVARARGGVREGNCEREK